MYSMCVCCSMSSLFTHVFACHLLIYIVVALLRVFSLTLYRVQQRINLHTYLHIPHGLLQCSMYTMQNWLGALEAVVFAHRLCACRYIRCPYIRSTVHRTHGRYSCTEYVYTERIAYSLDVCTYSVCTYIMYIYSVLHTYVLYLRDPPGQLITTHALGIPIMTASPFPMTQYNIIPPPSLCQMVYRVIPFKYGVHPQANIYILQYIEFSSPQVYIYINTYSDQYIYNNINLISNLREAKRIILRTR